MVLLGDIPFLIKFWSYTNIHFYPKYFFTAWSDLGDTYASLILMLCHGELHLDSDEQWIFCPSTSIDIANGINLPDFETIVNISWILVNYFVDVQNIVGYIRLGVKFN